MEIYRVVFGREINDDSDSQSGGSEGHFEILYHQMVRCLINYNLLSHLGNLTDEQHMWFLDFYKKFSTLGLQHENGQSEHLTQFYAAEMDAKYASVRQNCAYNFPVSMDHKFVHNILASLPTCLLVFSYSFQILCCLLFCPSFSSILYEVVAILTYCGCFLV